MGERGGDGVVSRWCRGKSGKKHAWRWMRTLGRRDARPGKTACQQPSLMVCEACLQQCLMDCKSHDPGGCRPCAKRYRREVRSVVAEQLQSAEDGTLWFVTLTAPGSVTGESHDDHVDGDAVARWNEQVPGMWNRFVEELKRSIPGFSGLAYVKVGERQKRGTLHLHAAIRTQRRVELLPATLVRIQEVGIRLGFGRQTKFARVKNSRADREKVASYLVKDVACPPLWVGERRAGARWRRMRVFTASRNWGTTIAQVRARARSWFEDTFLRSTAEEPQAPATHEPTPAVPLPS